MRPTDPVLAAVYDAVTTAFDDVLRPFLPRLSRPEKRTYSFAEAADVIGCSPKTVARLVNRGVLPVLPELGARRVIPRVAVEAFADGREVSVSPRSGGVDDTGISELGEAS